MSLAPAGFRRGWPSANAQRTSSEKRKNVSTVSRPHAVTRSVRHSVMPRFPPAISLCLLLLTCWSAAASAATKGGLPQTTAFDVRDVTGMKVSFARLPQRIVVVGQGPFMPMHLLYMFPECRERLVGYEEKFKNTDTFLPFVDPQFSKKVALATNPGPEQVAALHPDLVVMKGSTPTPLGESLAVLGIPVVYLGMEDPERFLQEVDTVGVLFGNRPRAAEIRQFYQTRLDRLKSRVEGVKPAGKPRVLVMEYNDRGGKAAVQVPGKSWTQTIQAQRAGGNPVWLEATQASEGWTITNFEQVAAWDPDKVFIIPWFTLDPKEVLASFRTDPRWRLLKAVKGNELYIFPSDIFGWDSAEPRWILGMTWMATRIFPDRFKDVDMKQEVYQFFERMYAMEKSIIDTAVMPKILLEGR